MLCPEDYNRTHHSQRLGRFDVLLCGDTLCHTARQSPDVVHCRIEQLDEGIVGDAESGEYYDELSVQVGHSILGDLSQRSASSVHDDFPRRPLNAKRTLTTFICPFSDLNFSMEGRILKSFSLSKGCTERTPLQP